MPPKIDLTGQKIGKLTIVSPAPNRGKTTYWTCQCDCGIIKEIRTNALRSGKTISCGCAHREKLAVNEIGNVYGKLTVIDLAKSPTSDPHAYWLCQCECGNMCVVSGTNLRKGQISCGCSRLSIKTGDIYGLLTVIQELPNNTWQCQCACGNTIISKGRELLRGHRLSCGCAVSVGQAKILQILQQNNIYVEQEKTFNTCRFSTTNQLARFDFYLPEYNILIEYDGEQHYRGWGGDSKNLQDLQKRDAYKNKWCKENNIILIRIPYSHFNKIELKDLLLDSEFII